MKNIKNNRGFAALEVIILVLALGLLGFVGYRAYQARQAKPAETAAPAKTEKKEADKNEGYIVIKEWGVRFKLHAGLSDVQYRIHGERAAFYAKPAGLDVQYRKDYDRLNDGSPGSPAYAIGTLIRSADPTEIKMNEPVAGKKIGNYYFYTFHSFSGLSTGAGPTGLFDTDSSCDRDVNGAKCKAALDAETKAFHLVNGTFIDNGLLETIEEAK